MSGINSYGKLYNLGHRAIVDLLLDEVLVEEKIDGSQFSMAKINGELYCRSKGKELIIDAPEKMFNKAVDTAKELLPMLNEGWFYRGEYLQKPKHNTLSYLRTPEKNIMIFDIDTGDQNYLSYDDKKAECERLGLECIPFIHKGKIDKIEQLNELLKRTSVLGGADIEGVVIKNYSRFGVDGKTLMGKHVSEAFKEVHSVEWRKSNPTKGDIIEQLILGYRTEARWHKAIQHVKERGELTDTPKDIGTLMKEISIDTKAECEDEIKERLFKYAWPKISRSISAGFPQFYKNELMKKQFDND